MAKKLLLLFSAICALVEFAVPQSTQINAPDVQNLDPDDAKQNLNPNNYQVYDSFKQLWIGRPAEFEPDSIVNRYLTNERAAQDKPHTRLKTNPVASDESKRTAPSMRDKRMLRFIALMPYDDIQVTF